MIERKSTIKKLIALGVLILVFITLTLISRSTDVCEFFATTFARAWIFVFGHIFSLLPISGYELFLITAIVLAIVFVIFLFRFLAARKWKKLLSMLLITAITVFTFLDIYTATATMTYNRHELPDNIYTRYNGDDFSREEAIDLAQIIVDGANEAYEQTEHDANGNIVFPYDMKELSRRIDQAFKVIDGNYLSSYTPRGKKIINKTIMSELHITGVFFAPFGEANINGYENNMYLPQTLAHEIAHSKGVMKEDQAELVSLYVLLCSDDPYLRYAAYSICTNSALSILWKYPNTEQLCADFQNVINPGIRQERSNYSKFYAQFNHLDILGQRLNDLYLKLQKQPEGVGSYEGEIGEMESTGEIDDEGRDIHKITKFYATENLLITLYKQDKLK